MLSRMTLQEFLANLKVNETTDVDAHAPRAEDMVAFGIDYKR